MSSTGMDGHIWVQLCDGSTKVDSKADIAVGGNHLTAAGKHMSYRITQCYLPVVVRTWKLPHGPE